ncbi:uncharacterized protein LOC121375590 [Gigantopelta aegis]|uniref:uncharacterized protein LOC121375590 n=1 Tax=Gigantopelta aegis TaxID=1735272 RepID=UPI001B88B7A1|nr:uncharacterized protein LOC121375590 [Gigantopelta aegis]
MRRGHSSTNALLQKVSSQLKGERVPIKTREEDELTAYLTSLALKTSQQTKSVNFEDYGENISISSDSHVLSQSSAHQKIPKLSAEGSKFLKKKTSEKPQENSASVSKQRSAMPVPISSAQKYSSAASSLKKAAAVVQSIPERRPSPSAYKSYIETDTEDTSVSLAKYMHPRPRSASDHSIGKDGSRFLRKSQEKIGEGDMRSSRPAVADRSSPIHNKQHAAREKVPEYAYKGSVKYASSVHLTSEEESLADFRHRLESSDKKTRNKSAERMMRAQSPFRQSPPPDRPSTRRRSSSYGSPRRTPSPQGVHAAHSRYSRSVSQDSDNVDSIISEAMDSADSSPDQILSMVNLMDIDSLEPALLAPKPQVTSKNKSGKKDSKSQLLNKQTTVKDSPFKAKKEAKTESVFKAKEKSDSVFKVKDSHKESKGSVLMASSSDSPFKPKSKGTEKLVFKAKNQVDSSKGSIFKKDNRAVSKATKKSTGDSDLLQKFGVMSVNDLLGDIESEKTDSLDGDNSEIVTERSDIFASRNRADSVSEVVTHMEPVMKRQTSQHSLQRKSSPDFSDRTASISEKIGIQSSERSVSDSRRRSLLTDDDTGPQYTEDFEEDVAGSTLSESSSIESEVEPTKAKKSRVEMKSAEVQTEKRPGLSYKWDLTASGLAISGPGYGLDFVDPTPIASHVVSADALEAVTSYSPCMLALHDLLKQQLALTTNFLEVQNRLYENYTSSIESNYHYTTLEATKEYIKKHRKPRLTFKKALKMVTNEMDR